MATTYSRPLIYKDTSDSNRMKLLVGKTSVYLQPDGSTYPTGRVQLTETSAGVSGIYKNAAVTDGLYSLYIDDVQQTQYGTFAVGAGVDLSLYALKSGSNTFTGNNFFNSNTFTYYPSIHTSSSWYVAGVPPYNSSLAWKGWVLAEIASISVTPYQESINKVRCIVGGTVETGKVYNTAYSSSNYFASPGIDNQCEVEISGTNSISRYITFDSGTLRSYVHWKGTKKIHVVMSDAATLNKTCIFEDLNIYFGNNDFTSAREYTGMRFEDCDIYCYNNTTFTDCELIRCRIFHSSTFKAYLKGATKVELTGFNNEPDKTLLTSGYTAGTYGMDVTTLPTDPSTTIN